MATNAGIPGRLPDAPQEWSRAWASMLVNQLTRTHDLLTRAISTGWLMSNVTVTRTLNANLASSSHTVTDATTTPVAAGSIGAITGAALSTSDTYTDSAVNAGIDVVVGNLRTAIDAETDVNTALMEAAINAAIAVNNTNTEVALDALGADVLVLADVVATLVDDMKARGMLSD